jgi:DNA-binding transcriptional ArsR family regulator
MARIGHNGKSARTSTGQSDETSSVVLETYRRILQAGFAAPVFKLVSDPYRLQLILLLAAGERDLGSLCEALGMGRSDLVRHLAVLRQCGFATPRRSGEERLYRLTEAGQQMARVVRYMLG